MSDSAEWLRNLARNYADGVPGMKPEDHHAWEIAAEIEQLQLERDNYIRTTGYLRIDNERLRAALALSQSQNYCTLCGVALDGTSGERVATSGDRSNK